MIDINILRKDPELIRTASKNKGHEIDVDAILKIDEQVRQLQGQVEAIKSEKNKASKLIASSAGKEREKLIKDMQELDKKSDKLIASLAPMSAELEKLLRMIPNIPAEDVPIGKNESENKVIRHVGEPTVFNFKPLDHVELGEKLGILDTKKAVQVSGARFVYIKGALARMESALVQYVYDILTSEPILKKIADSIEPGYSAKPFIPVVPPVMIRPDVMRDMARLSEADKDERYYLPQDDLYLVGSAEHTLGPLHMNEILSEEDMPIRYVGFSPAFRREAGSYGKDTHGMIRVHQFNKLEMESFSLPEDSIKEQDFFVAIQEYLVQSLGLPYRVVAICTGDMGAPDARQIDIECWMPSQNKYRETHTSDLMTDYQSRRLQTRVKRNKKTEFVHMNDATAIAMSRIPVAILENYQQADGSVVVPEVLRPYMNIGDRIVPPKK
ncbi:MAG: hypothetical protein ACD_76C00105G0008 [uncultured bacterium]|nr:MAG: hypothetical protein ACD_76C00105G0008 [uncultured bacterium]HBD04988.1 serine--tRNA ligase [Candidatus Uhrbacteria bacterium]